MADGKSDPDDGKPLRRAPAKRRASELPPAAIQRAKEIAESAPPVSDAKLARLRLLLHGAGTTVADGVRDKQELSPAMREFVDETVAKAPPMPDELRADLCLIIWGSRAEANAEEAPGPRRAAVPAPWQRERADAELPLSDPGYRNVGPEALDLLTIAEVAARLRCSVRTVRRLVYAERKVPGTGLESVRLGSLVRIPPEAVAAYIARLRQDGAR